jgi:hypothetical protein
MSLKVNLEHQCGHRRPPPAWVEFSHAINTTKDVMRAELQKGFKRVSHLG